jgi:hypothetical protein
MPQPRRTFQVIRTDLRAHTERVLHDVGSQEAADQLVISLSTRNRNPSVLFFWTVRDGATFCHSADRLSG